MKRARPWYVPYLTKTLAFEEPRNSDPSTYTELHDDETLSEKQSLNLETESIEMRFFFPFQRFMGLAEDGN